MHTMWHALLWWVVFVVGSTLLMYASVLIWLVPALLCKLLMSAWRGISHLIRE